MVDGDMFQSHVGQKLLVCEFSSVRFPYAPMLHVMYRVTDTQRIPILWNTFRLDEGC